MQIFSNIEDINRETQEVQRKVLAKATTLAEQRGISVEDAIGEAIKLLQEETCTCRQALQWQIRKTNMLKKTKKESPQEAD